MSDDNDIHLRPKMERTYDQHDYRAEMREALQLWADHIRQILSGGKVVALKRVKQRV